MFFPTFCFHSGSPTCLMSLVSLGHQWSRWLRAANFLLSVVWSSILQARQPWQSLPCCCSTALQYDDTRRCEAAQHQLAEMSRVELNLAAAASPSDKLGKLELIHQRPAKQSGTLFEFCRRDGPGKGLAAHPSGGGIQCEVRV
ncbi:hypothetical protein DHEL01_v208696 [Diaporthe helianthi]|uniref:Uncharacterized protein n=1 Tax=Diaporthe helianthi TaxID=158607 RepID=A0A2P5HRK8_DIAHE|nr:hypothetical protein DHEL01_v208696 [Diaporthe helianthi]